MFFPFLSEAHHVSCGVTSEHTACTCEPPALPPSPFDLLEDVGVFCSLLVAELLLSSGTIG